MIHRVHGWAIAFVPVFLCLSTAGCIGFINGYMADPSPDPEFRRMRSSSFPAVEADLLILRHPDDDHVNAVGKIVLPVLVVLDIPVSAAVDLLILPFRALGHALHPNSGAGTRPTSPPASP